MFMDVTFENYSMLQIKLFPGCQGVINAKAMATSGFVFLLSHVHVVLLSTGIFS